MNGKTLMDTNNPKVIAFYLPQFHQFDENDKWHGRGFTEWTNVTKTIPQFVGHEQPQLPIDVGFYDLTTSQPFYRQIELAKNYGLYGFCFYYYWFHGKKLMEKPIHNYLEDKNLDFPFCLCWACESWNKSWDGKKNDKQLLFDAKLGLDDVDEFWNDLRTFLHDDRYIKIDNNPLILVYRPSWFDKQTLRDFCAILREKAVKEGFNGLYFVLALSNEYCRGELNLDDDIKYYNFNGCYEFPPHGMFINSNCKKKKIPASLAIDGYMNPKFSGYVYNMKDYILHGFHIDTLTDCKNLFRGIFPRWDNSARRLSFCGGDIFFGLSPICYKQWLSDLIKWTTKNKSKKESFIFINAWNEWAEGAHLEPDNRYGYAYLQATCEALEENE